jgi:hypothetical protein
MVRPRLGNAKSAQPAYDFASGAGKSATSETTERARQTILHASAWPAPRGGGARGTDITGVNDYAMTLDKNWGSRNATIAAAPIALNLRGKFSEHGM